MTPDVEAAITDAAKQRGIDPAFALAVADRESNGNPNASASRTIRGLFQMSGPLRAQYGIGDSNDATTQAQGWTRFAGDLKGDMGKRLGRDPTNPEVYLGHYFGAGRASRMISGQIAPSTDVRDVFTPQELAENPEIAKAGTVGALVNSVEGDISRRETKFGAGGDQRNSSNSTVSAQGGPDFGAFGVGEKGEAPSRLTYKSTAAPGPMPPMAQPIDFAQYGQQNPVEAPAEDAAAAAPAENDPQQSLSAETPAAMARQHMMQQAMGFGPPPVGGIAAEPGQQAQSAAPLAVPQSGSQLQAPAPVGPMPNPPQATNPQGGQTA